MTTVEKQCPLPLCSQTTGWIKINATEWKWDQVTHRFYKDVEYDKLIQNHVCDRKIIREWKCYTVCSETAAPEYGSWSDWIYDQATGKFMRTRHVVIRDKYNHDKICDEYDEKEYKGYPVLIPTPTPIPPPPIPPPPKVPPTNGQNFPNPGVTLITGPAEAGKETAEVGGLERMLEQYGEDRLPAFLERIQVWSAALAQNIWWDPTKESTFFRTFTWTADGRNYTITADTTTQGVSLADSKPYVWNGFPHHGVVGTFFDGRKIAMGIPLYVDPGHHIPSYKGFAGKAWIGLSPIIGDKEEMAEVDPLNRTQGQDLAEYMAQAALYSGFITGDGWWEYGNNSLENALGEAGYLSLYAYYMGENPDLSQAFWTCQTYNMDTVKFKHGRERGLPTWGWTPQGFYANPEKVQTMFHVILPPADFLGQSARTAWEADIIARGWNPCWTTTQLIDAYIADNGGTLK